MAITLVSTISGETSNSYVSLADANDYWTNHYATTKVEAWAALTDSQKTLALINACRVIERYKFTVDDEYTFAVANRQWAKSGTGTMVELILDKIPVRRNAYQRLQFPRNYDQLSNGTVIIPEDIKAAQCEQALYMTTVDDSALTAYLSGVSEDSVRAGSVSLSQTYHGGGSLLSPMAHQFISQFVVRSSKIRRA